MSNVIHAQFGAERLSSEAVWQQAVGAEFVAALVEKPHFLAPVISIAEMPEDEELTRQARKNLLSFKAGSIATNETIESPRKPVKNMQDALLNAREGDPEGLEIARLNTSTHAMEVLFKSGNYKRVKLETDSRGKIMQSGQAMDDVHRNTYHLSSKHPVLKERTIAESNNGIRIEYCNREGYLEDYYFVVFSMCPEDLSDKELDELFFFSQTKSMSVQLTSKDKKGLYTETGFVAGDTGLNEGRHDREAVESTAAELGEDYAGLSTSQIIDRPMLIRKDLLPNGLVDLIKMLDDKSDTFFGEKRPKQDYQEFKEFCEQREDSFTNDINEIVAQLVTEAPILATAERACRRLAKLVEERMVRRAVKDKAIEPWVFGTESAKNIVWARKAIANGNQAEFKVFEQKAIDTARSGACTAGSCGLESPSSKIEEKELQDFLNLTEEEKKTLEITKDTERACVKCGEKTVVYASNSKTVKKGCTSCGETENVTKNVRSNKVSSVTFLGTKTKGAASSEPTKKAA